METSRQVPKRALSVVLCIVLTLALMPALMPTERAYADESDVFAGLGIDTTKKPSQYPDDGSNPYGRNNVILKSVRELFVGSDNSASSYNDSLQRTYRLYGHNSEPEFWAEPNIGSTTVGNKYDASLTASGSFFKSSKTDDTGTKRHIVALGANTIRDKNNAQSDRANAGLFMYFIDPRTGEQTASGAINLYKGAIGNSFELDGGYLRYDASKDKDNGGSETEGFYNPHLLQNYMQVVTGDFTGDGTDEIAVYVPQPSNPRIEIWDYTNTAANWKEAAGWTLIASRSISIAGVDRQLPNKVSMVAGDINYDGIDDLAVGYGCENYTNYGEPKNTSIADIAVYFGTGNNFAVSGSPKTFNTGQPGVYNLAFGDLTSAGRDCLIIAQAKHTQKRDSGRTVKSVVSIQAYAYNPDTGTFASAGLTMNEADGPDKKDKAAELDRDLISPHVRADAVAVSPGVGMADNLYYRGHLWSFTSGGMSRASLTTEFNNSAYGWNTNLYGNSTDFFYEYGITAADLDYDYKDEVIFTYVPVDGNDDGPDTQPARGLVLGIQETPGKTTGDPSGWSFQQVRLFKGEPTYPNRHDRSLILMATPDTDTDTVSLVYKGQRLSYTDPKVLAVLAGAPVHGEVASHTDTGAIIDDSETTWGTYESQGSSATKGGTFSAGFYIGYEQNVSFGGVNLFSFEMEAEYKHSTTWETEKTSTITHAITYKTEGYEDAVVIYSVPIAIYEYEMTIPKGVATTGTTKQAFYVNIPYSPAVEVVSVDKYDKIAASHPDILPTVRGNILTHTEGKPFTYPANSSKMKDPLEYKNTPSRVGIGNGSIEQSVTVEESEESRTTHQEEFSFKVGGGAGGFKAGITLGGSAGYGKAKISTTGSTFTGTVNNLPKSVEGYGYDGYTWKLVQYWYEPPASVKHSKIPVVTYLVDYNINTQPIPIPQNPKIDLSKTTSDSLTLTWEYETGLKNMIGFKIWRLNEAIGSYTKLAGDPVSYKTGQSSYSLTFDGLDPGKKYTYKVQAISNRAPEKSILSEQAEGITAGDGVTLTYAASPAQGGSVRADYTKDGTAVGKIESGAAVVSELPIVLTATPNNSGYEFVTWQIERAGKAPTEDPGVIAPTGKSTLSFEMYSEATTITAVFQEKLADVAKPLVLSVSPSGQTSGADGDLFIVFDEPMDTSVVGNIALTSALGNATLTTSSNQKGWVSETTYWSYYHGAVSGGTEYAVDLSGFKDAAGNEMLPDATHTFTTLAADQKSVFMGNKRASAKDTPTAGVAGTLDCNGKLYYFSDLDANKHSLVLNNPNNVPGITLGAINSIGKNGDGTPNGTFYVYIYTSASTPAGTHVLSLDVTDVAGGPPVASNPFFITVLDKANPQVIDVVPSGDEAARSGTIFITFDEAMDRTAGVVSLDGGISSLPNGTWIKSTVYAAPYENLDAFTTYTVGISGFKDWSGNELSANSAYSFTTVDTQKYTLTVTGAAGSGSYEAGEPITLTADAAPAGQVFEKWTIVGTGELSSVDEATTTFTMPAADTEVKALFTDLLVDSITISGEGGVDTIATDGGTLQLLADILPVDAANQNVFWSIENGAEYATINSGTGLLTAIENGTVVVKATAMDSSNASDTFTVTISGQLPKTFAPTITTDNSLPNGRVGVAYSLQLAASGDAPITWSIPLGSLPLGLTLSDGTISGTPLAPGTTEFTVKATNATGEDTKELTLIIDPAIVQPVVVTITDHPESSSVKKGETITLTVTATGDPAPTHQWQKHNGTDWEDIPGATNATLTIEDADESHAGSYRCVVSNTAGPSATSDPATVTVTVPEDPKPPVAVDYFVTYDSNGATDGTVPDDSTAYREGATVTVLGNTGSLVKTGFTFAGWTLQADGSGTVYQAGDTLILERANIKLYAQWKETQGSLVEKEYKFTKTFAVFTGSGDLTGIADGPFADFKGLYIDENLVPKEHTVVESGSTVITIKESYLKTLGNGTYDVVAQFADGSAKTLLKVSVEGNTNPAKMPRTGDIIGLEVLAFLALTCLASGVLVLVNRRRAKKV